MGKVIAIDGPAGAGKGTLAKELAKKLGYVNIDTGATYRCVALEVLREGVSIDDGDRIAEISSNIKIDLLEDGTVLLNGDDVTHEIRSKEVTNIVSPISSFPKVRENMVNIQRNIAANKDVVMEGRDITTVVFPNADYKFYLDASLDERTRRRFEENKEKGINMSYDEIYNNIKERDYNDMHKDVGALTRTDDQVYIDCTNLTVSEEIDIILNVINK